MSAPKRKNKSKKWIFWVVLVVLFVVAVGVTYLVWQTYFKDVPRLGEKTKTITTEVIQVQEEENSAENTDNSSDAPEKKVVQYEGEDPNNSADLTGAITYAGLSPDGNSLMIQTNIDQYLNGGTCELILMRGGETVYNASTRIVPGVSTSACEGGFNVPLTQISVGNLQIIVNLSSGGKTGVLKGEAKI